MLAGLKLWMEPESGNVGYNAVGDDLTLVGSPTHQPDGPSPAVDTVSFTTGKWAHLPNLTGYGSPIDGVDGSWWEFFIFRTSFAANHMVCGNGSATAVNGRYTTINTSNASIGLVMRGGGAFTSTSIPFAYEGSLLNEYHAVLIEYHHQAKDANTSIVTATVDGIVQWNSTNSRRDLNIATVTFPIVATNKFTVGDFREGGGSGSTFRGDLAYCCGSGTLTNDERWALFNHHRRFRKYTGDMENRRINDDVKWCEAKLVTDRSASYVFRSDVAQTVKLYGDSSGQRGSLVDTHSSVAPDSRGFVTGNFTGLTANTQYHIVATNADGIESIHELRAHTVPDDDTEFSVLLLGDWSQKHPSVYENVNTPFQMFSRSKVPIVRQCPGDWGYWDELSADEANHVAAIDLHFSGQESPADTAAIFKNAEWSQLNRWYVQEKIGLAGFAVSDHDACGDDCDGTFAGNPAWVRVCRAMHPGYTFAAADHVYGSFDLTDHISVWMFDTRSESDYVAEDIISAAQLTAFSDWLASLATNSQIGIIMSERIYRGREISTEFWDNHPTTDWADLTAVQNAVATASAAGKILTICADVHMQGFDDGASPDGQLLRSCNPGAMHHGTANQKGVWKVGGTARQASGAQGHYSILTITNQTQAAPALEIRAYQNATQTLSGFTWSFSLTK